MKKKLLFKFVIKPIIWLTPVLSKYLRFFVQLYSLLYHFVLIFRLSLKITTSSFCRKGFLGVRKIYIFYLNVISITFLFSAVLTIHQNCETQDRGESNTSNFSKLKNISMCYPNNKMAVSQAVCSGT